MPKKPIKCYISLNEASDINENISTIFDNVTLFSEKGFTSEKLFKLLKYESGDRLINYKFPLTTQGIQVTQEHIEDIQTYIDLFTEKFKYKYLALIESEDFEYDPLDNTDLTQNDNSTRTPNLAGTITDSVNKTTNTTNNLTDKNTKNLTTTNDLTDTTTYNNLKDQTDYNSTVSNDGSVTYGKKTTDKTTNDTNTNSVVPYDSTSFFSANKGEHTADSSSTLSGTDEHEDTDKKTGNDITTRTGSFTVKHTGTVKDSGTDTTEHTGTVGKVETGGVTRTTSSTGTEENESEMHRKGFQPQYSISSRQDMVDKYRKVSDFSAVSIYISEVANYILLGMYSNFEFVSPNLD